MLGNTRLPGPFSRLPIAWAIALIVFILAGLSAATKAKSGSQQALILAVVGLIFVIRGAMIFNQRRARTEPSATALGAAAPAQPAAPPGAFASAVLDTVIEARELTKRYEHVLAVDGVSFSVHRGEIFGLLGPNGAGKSTTLEMLEGLRDIDSGTAVVLGTDITEHAVEVKRRIGVQLQATALPCPNGSRQSCTSSPFTTCPTRSTRSSIRGPGSRSSMWWCRSPGRPDALRSRPGGFAGSSGVRRRRWLGTTRCPVPGPAYR
jgi:hypothetical protein